MSQQQAPHAARGQGACPPPLNATPALVRAVLDSAPLPARSPGRGAFHAPRFICQVLGHPLAAGASSDDRLPPQSADQPRGRCSGLGRGLNALAPRHPSGYVAAPLRLRLRCDCAPHGLQVTRVTAHRSRSSSATSAASSAWCVPPCFLCSSPTTGDRTPCGLYGKGLRRSAHVLTRSPFGAAASVRALAIQPVRMVSRHARATNSGSTVAKQQHHPHAAAGKREGARNLGTR